MKYCKRCYTEKENKEFYKDKESIDGLKYYCKDCTKNHVKKYYKIHKKERKEYSNKYHKNNREKRLIYFKQQTKNRKLKIIEAYGGKCNCCGESTFEFLSIEHKKKDGNKQKRELGGAVNFHNWLIKNNFPKDNFELLCFNCNLSKGFYGYCPHNK